MPGPKYTPLHSEEDGEDVPSKRNFGAMTWSHGFNIRYLIFNMIIFTAGLFVGLVLNDARPRVASDQLAQYSMVPCKSAVSSVTALN